MTKRLLLAMAIGSVVLGCNKDSTVNRVDPSGGGEAGGGASGGALEGSGGGTTGGTGGATEASGGLSTGGTSSGGSSSGGEGGDPETTGGEGGAAEPTGGASTGSAGGEGGDAETTGGEGGGVATTGGAGGAVVATGGDSSGGATTGGAGGDAGASGGLAGGSADTGGAGGAAGGGAGPGGAAGAGGTDSTVRGRVIDFWRHPIPNIPVEVNGTVTTTDDDGEFEVADVPAVYDASFVVQNVGRYGQFTHGWVYQDLTRRDPTLQIYQGLTYHSERVELLGENVTEIDDPLLGLSIAGPDGSFPTSSTNPTAFNPSSVDWHGPVATTATAHALFMRLNPDNDFPIDYVAYDSPRVALVDGAPPTVRLDLSRDEIPAGNLLGTVTAPVDPDRSNQVFVRFPTGGAIKLLSDAAGPDSFSYLVPNLPQGSLTVAASATYANGGLSIAHEDGLSGGSEPVALTLPTPSGLAAPAGGANGVDSTTSFQFIGSPDCDAYLVTMSSYYYNSALYVVTSREEFNIPEVLGGDFQLLPDDLVEWWVETHGDAGSVDEMAASGGFMDAFSADEETPKGPRLGSGSYTASSRRSFTTAP